MLRHPDLTRKRIQHFGNTLINRLYGPTEPVTLEVYSAPDRITWAEAQQGQYRPAQVGEFFGPDWSTHWFRVSGRIPAAWQGREVHFLWDSFSEACVWVDGVPHQGLTGKAGGDGRPIRPEYIVTRQAQGGEAVSIVLEMACNHFFGQGARDQMGRPLVGTIKQAELAVFDRALWDLTWDFVTIMEMALHLPEHSPRAGQALATANAMVNVIDVDNSHTWSPARAIAARFLAERNGMSQHNTSAVGHAHIDSAWLWPRAETKRKCYRTFATALRLMEEYPHYRFACSQAVQWEWMRDEHPQLFAQLKQRAQEGRFIPAGGSWVEPDCNIPSGESLVRQFLFGQRFFMRELGIRCKEFWNPDVFGYSGQLPQIMRGFEMPWFLTQKLSWNQFNKHPSHSFLWEGIDGSQVLTHFPPSDTYNHMADIKGLVYGVSNYKDHTNSRESYLLFGYGDGGGGPTREMLERLERVADVDGLPRVQQRSPAQFFERFERDLDDPLVWVGELYFELHRGTYTTQADNKRNNRRCEEMLHDVEFLAALAWQSQQREYPHAALDALWKTVLFNQFHDVIPGSSIGAVYADSDQDYAEVLARGAELRQQALAAFKFGAKPAGKVVAVNTLGCPRREIVALPFAAATAQKGADGQALAVVEAPALGYSIAAPGGADTAAVSLVERADAVILENDLVQVVVGRDGHVRRYFDKAARRDVLQPGDTGNRFVLFDDNPHNWDAWEVDTFHLEKSQDVAGAAGMKILETGPLRAVVEFSFQLSDRSTLVQQVSLDAISPRLDFACTVDWHERHRFLKVEFPVNVRAMEATYEIQFGHLKRPTHFNSSWDMAKFEVCAHRWADLSEPDYGVALLNDSKYGYATHGNVMRLSLLRSPTSPDPEADQGRHFIRFALFPHQGGVTQADVVAEAMRFNSPLLLAQTSGPDQAVSYLSVDQAGVFVDTVKKAEDSKHLIVRLYEAHGRRVRVRLSSPLAVLSACLCNLLEEDGPALAWNGGADLELTPFQVVTLKLGC